MLHVIIQEKDGPRQDLSLDKTEISIGRIPANDIPLPKNNVSKRHAKVVWQDDHWEIVDLKSTNGTYVNGQRVGNHPLIGTDQVIIGDFLLLFEVDGAAASTGPQVGMHHDMQESPAQIQPNSQFDPHVPTAPPAGGFGSSAPAPLPMAGFPPAPNVAGNFPPLSPAPNAFASPPASQPLSGALGGYNSPASLPPAPPVANPFGGQPSPPLGAPISSTELPGSSAPNLPVVPSAPLGHIPSAPLSNIPSAPLGNIPPAPTAPPMVEDSLSIDAGDLIIEADSMVGTDDIGVVAGIAAGLGEPIPTQSELESSVRAATPIPPTEFKTSGPPSQDQIEIEEVMSGIIIDESLQAEEVLQIDEAVQIDEAPQADDSFYVEAIEAGNLEPDSEPGPLRPRSKQSSEEPRPEPKLESEPEPLALEIEEQQSESFTSNDALVNDLAPVMDQTIPVTMPVLKSSEDVVAMDLLRQQLLHQFPQLYQAQQSQELSRETLLPALEESYSALLSDNSISSELDRQQLFEDVILEATAWGPISNLLENPEVSAIVVNRFDQIHVEEQGRMEPVGAVFSSEEALQAVIARMIAPLGLRPERTGGVLEQRLVDGTWIHALFHPISRTGTTLYIRPPKQSSWELDQLVASETLSPQMTQFLNDCLQNRRNILLAGDPGSGRTTLLNAIALQIPTDERVLSVESVGELQLPHPNWVALETRAPDLYGNGTVNMRELIIHSLRINPQRLLVGDVDGAAMSELLPSLVAGLDGVCLTGRAHSSQKLLQRLETLVQAQGSQQKNIKGQLVESFDVVIQLNQYACGTRKVTAIQELTGVQNDQFELQDLFVFDNHGTDTNGQIQGSFRATGTQPQFYQELLQRGAHLDTSIFS